MTKATTAAYFAKKYYRIAQFRLQDAAENMTQIILFGSFIVTLLLILLLVYGYTALDHEYVLGRIIGGFVILGYLGIIRILIRTHHPKIGAWLLVALYGFVSILVLHTWGINTPVGILALSFVIILTSTILGARHIPAVTLGVIGILFLLHYSSAIGLTHPDSSTLDDLSTYSDAVIYSVIFCIFSLIMWLSGMRTEDTLKRAVKAESALQKERDALATQVEQQRLKLMNAHQKELKQLYKFAELGQLTSIILHELANHLSILVLDIDNIKERTQNSLAIKHATESIFYIDTIIDQVRSQISDGDNLQQFDIADVTSETVKQLRLKLSCSTIKFFIESSPGDHYLIYGDPLRLSQVITILVSNAAQAGVDSRAHITLELSSTKSHFYLSVKDFGKGISKERRQILFQPGKSTKKAGLGIGLYLTKQIIETHFKGTVTLDPSTEYTQFNIELPKKPKP